MLVVRAEIWPAGDETAKFTVGEITAANESDFGDFCSYAVSVSQTAAPWSGAPSFETTFAIHDHDRRQGAWALVASILRALPATAIPGAPQHQREDNMLGLFLDVLPAAWGLSEAEFEQLLNLPCGWLRAWRNHEVKIDDELKRDINELGVLQRRIRLVRTPDGYSRFWHHRWTAGSTIGARTPWQAFVEDGPAVLTALRRHLDSGWQ